MNLYLFLNLFIFELAWIKSFQCNECLLFHTLKYEEDH